MKCESCSWKNANQCLHPNVKKGGHPFPDCEGGLWKGKGFANAEEMKEWDISVKSLEAKMVALLNGLPEG